MTKMLLLHQPYALLKLKKKKSLRVAPLSFFRHLSPTIFGLVCEDRKKETKIVAAYLLAVLGGNTNPSAGYLKAILGSVGAEAEDDRIDFLLYEVKGKDVTELTASGREKFPSVRSGGGVAVAVAPAAGGSAAPAAAAAEPKKEDKVEEKEESDEDMGFSLFD